ncbi:MAG: hypothetical protein IK062_11475 [Selenomonadaceae bacterium]|nr:hypothetical protein [Selenomonadaceae bacterium]
MANTIGLNYSTLFKNSSLTEKRSFNSGKNSAELKNSSSAYEKNFSVELSEGGLNALSNLQKNSVEDVSEKNFAADEKKLSAKAQDYLDKLREKYGDYDFVVADNVDDPQSFSKQSDRNYSVILSTEEIEKMAEDEEYADKVMGQVDKAVGVIDKVLEEPLEDGVQFSSLAVSVDDEGNMKLFAGLEKMSEEQRDRLEKLKEKRSEEKDSESVDKENEETEEEESFSVKSFQVEADSTEDLFKKIFNINWNE